jgi:hypothetical protein
LGSLLPLPESQAAHARTSRPRSHLALKVDSWPRFREAILTLQFIDANIEQNPTKKKMNKKHFRGLRLILLIKHTMHIKSIYKTILISKYK